MKAKYDKLIQILNENQPCTASILANKLNVSERSIKTYIHDINKQYPFTILSSRKGYSINNESISNLFDDLKDQIPQTSNDRVVYILKKMIQHKINTAINIYDLCDEMYISLSTVKIELKKVKRKLARFDLSLIISGDLISICGMEKNKRKLLSDLIYDESTVNFVNLKSLQETFSNIDIEYIKQIIITAFEEFQYFINDYSLVNLILHLTIAIDRIRNQNMNEQKVNSDAICSSREYQIASNIAENISSKYNIVYSKAEIYEMTLLITSRATTLDYKSISINNLEKFIGKDCFTLVTRLIEDMNAYYYIDLNEQEFLIRFALHIRNLLLRSRNGHFNKNPLAVSIKTSCPLIYDASVSLAAIINEATSIKINDDEIAYIAFHLGSALEAQKNYTEKIKAILYCPSYYNLEARIIENINKSFATELIITNIITDESQFEMIQNEDIIIATIPASTVTRIPLIQITLFMTEKDIRILTNKIKELQAIKRKKEFESRLRSLLQPQLFEKRKTFTNHINCIKYMAMKFKENGFVHDSFIEDIFERERISSTAFGMFAIPHTMRMDALQTGINVMIVEQPFPWGSQQVSLIIMMCFNKHERFIFNQIYDPITMILNDKANLKKIIESQDYESFISTMVSYLD